MGIAETMRLNPLFLRHDLMIELGRIDMAIDDMSSHASRSEQSSLVHKLENQRAHVNEALSLLPV